MMAKHTWKTTPGGIQSSATTSGTQPTDSGGADTCCLGTRKKKREGFRCGTWNVRTLVEGGKFHNLVREMKRMKVDLFGISEHRWPDSGCTSFEDVTMYYSGGKSGRNGVAILIGKKFSNSIIKTSAISDRIMILHLKGQKQNINVIQAYAPTADKSDEELEEFYSTLQNTVSSLKKEDLNFILGDFNAKVGNIKTEGVTGSFGLGNRNERGDNLVEFCKTEEFVVKNTFFKLHPRRLYTWKSPQDSPSNIVRNQIDYILVNKRFQNSIIRTTTYPGADIGSDSNPVIADVRIKFRKITPKTGAQKRLDTQKLKNPQFKENFREKLEEKVPTIKETLNDSTNVAWEKIRDSALNVAKTEIGVSQNQRIKPWMIDAILDKMDLRRDAKLKNQKTEYTRIHKEIRLDVREAKVNWIKAQCKEAEELLAKHDSFNFHKKVKTITWRFRKKNLTAIRDELGNVIIEPDVLGNHWKSYIEQLFHDQRSHLGAADLVDLDGPDILQCEVEYALKCARNEKSPGEDNLPAEILKCINSNILTALFNRVYNSGEIPADWLQSTFVPIPKKPNAKSCSEFRLISLMSHILKIFLKVIHNRIYKKCEEHYGSTQFGFKKGMGTREALFSMKILMQKCYDFQQDLYICFIDYEKAFDTVKHEPLIKMLEEIGLDGKDIRIIAKLYWNQSATVKIDNNLTTENIAISKGVRQDCILSPLLFNVYLEKVFQTGKNSEKFGIKANGVKVWNIRYADDTALLAPSRKGLQKLLTYVQEAGHKFGIRLNVTKTKWMSVTRSKNQGEKLVIDGCKIEKVEKFRYLGSIINSEVDCSEEIRTRCGIAKETFRQLKNILICGDTPLELRIRVMQCYVIPVLLYGVETWSIKAASVKKLEATEMWFLRRLLKIPWIERVSNQEVLRRAGTERSLMKIIERRKTSYLGHILRGEKYGILRLILQGRVEGKRPKGRRKHSWSQNIKQWSGWEILGNCVGERENMNSEQPTHVCVRQKKKKKLYHISYTSVILIYENILQPLRLIEENVKGQ
ncbi:hypothetical protein PGB90_004699 [Kerria lacca]